MKKKTKRMSVVIVTCYQIPSLLEVFRSQASADTFIAKYCNSRLGYDLYPQYFRKITKVVKGTK